MLTTDWKTLALQAQLIFGKSQSRTLELFPFDSDETLEAFEKLPSAIGKSVTDFGSPAKFPVDKYYETLSKKDVQITEADPVELIQDIKSGKYTCVEVLTSYFHAALIASKVTNCVYEFLPDEALKSARYLDENKDKLVSHCPMFGLPISLKEMIPLTGHSVTHGSLCYLDRVVDYNADIVNILIKNGAVPFVRSTNPQSLMMLECESFTHGRTVNPFNSDLTCGGSSGGEGAINGIHASPIGLGSDIGGSIRCPSAFNGIYGMRTTVGRIPTSDYFSCQMGSESIMSVTGPLTRSLDTLELLMKTVVQEKPWKIDPSLTSIEWRNHARKTPYRIGILKTDGVVTPHPPISRALDIMFEKLQSTDNIEVFEFEPFNHQKAWEIISALYFEDGGDDTRKTLKSTGEPMCPQTEWILGKDSVKRLTVEEIWKWNLEKQKYRKDYLKHWLLFNNTEGNTPMDALIAPVFPGPAAKHRTAKYWGYTAQWNLLDYPVLVFPVTKVDLTKDIPIKDYKPRNEMDEFVYKQYDSPESFENSPISLGIVGLRNSEEQLIDIMKLINRQ
ncbi:uncharacterized protein AC631_03644 [Debaryomyces fabryi]|uniref:Amidase domain-containing protein n=1 Tax=Debaryomyces fabryi TaxID=58627 RepID=A0A0V1PWH3_9ASCO|nr:uncharacterized protein AC631_03644 [Debaryomyces fabryi]KSA00599.1 hypothetical protein AC631_03644 [Debaryomyces fabryi]CUM56209.1 unnamed protein product [Debaryomyces fabryi]